SIVLVRAGASYGRLNIPPIYDDVTYFVDALGRVQILLEKDVWHFAQSLVANPPHAPYSTLAASLGFLFCGVDPNGSVPAAPYLVNGLVLGLMAGFLLFLFGWFCGALLASREERSWKPSLIRLAFGIIPIAVLAGPYFIKQLPY